MHGTPARHEIHASSYGMRVLVLLIVLLVPCSQAGAGNADGDFNGAWTAWLCPSGSRYDPNKCSNFVLELFQKQDRLCGAHLFATAGARQLDEGTAPSLAGTIVDGIATVVVTSGRAAPSIQVQVTLKIVKGVLQWQRLDKPAGDYLLPLSVQLTRSRHATLFSTVFEQKLKAACSTVTNIAVDSDALRPPRASP